MRDKIPTQKENRMIPYKLIIGVIAGAALGFAYYKYIGCRTGG